MLCVVGGMLLRNLDPDGCEVYTDHDTARDFPTTCFGMAGMRRQGETRQMAKG